MSDLSRLATALSDRYRVERELGEGGMATVYLAEDLKHDRDVAIKVLKPELAAVLGAERFIAEIKTTAALQHPNILPLFDSGEADGFLYYVMPYVEGESLRDRLDRERQLGVDEAVKLVAEVADALQYAHEQGVVHRDIKPENILLHAGRPMVADFGIALAVSAAAGGRMTETGLSLGTPHYMSPEQATAEKEITGRSDIYSLASVLYEMLAGDPPHTGSSAQQIIVKIVTDEPRPITELRKSVPPNVAAALAKALEKLPADRFESAQAFANALADPNFTTATLGVAGAERAGPAPRRSLVVGLAVVALASVALAAWGWLRPRGTPADAVVEFWVDPPDTALAPGQLALSPDGTRLVEAFWNGGTPTLYQRLVADRTWQVVPGTDGGGSPFFSPDGAYLGFYTASDHAIRRIPVQGGSSRVVATISGQFGGGAWGVGNTIVYSEWPTGGLPTLYQVSADGGDPERVSADDGSARFTPHASWGGGDIFYTTLSPTGTTSISRLSLASGRIEILGPGLTPQVDAHDHLAYVSSGGGSLVVQRFDPGSGKLVGSPRRLAENVATHGGLTADFSVSATGSLVYRQAPNRGGELVLVNRSGTVDRRVDAPPGTMGILHPRFSPDGTRIAYVKDDLNSERGGVWVYSLTQGTDLRVSGDGEAADPAWAPDGRRIGYSFVPAGKQVPARLFVAHADGTGATQVMAAPTDLWQMAFVPGSDDIVFRSGNDLFRASLGRDTVPVPLTNTPAMEQHPAPSPDGRWLAYTSDVSGQNEVYISPYPGMGSRVIVSVGGGEFPVWSPRGDELFYVSKGALVAARVRVDAGRLSVVDRTTLFQTDRYAEAANRNYDVSPDGKLFVMVRAGETRAVWRVNALSAVARGQGN